ncbi:hypothetical protein JX265_003521 [Neoarthrinium moseri]|uniref:Uncharacterized protein n=1 Tax=Neoarthrinium moseri TaxID=1658444 RepID=A0A9P9WSC9_9PEZI|nr:uncharacterized protein JN550_002263 [Neoarthrinium moseri]KAI1850150.1 hypothetical protein JX266_004529 [Neoarthrinium moseri]KAI1874834.1 hypothetical protein JN550_002263 [Neoarthrinium moseri]KAI1877513.1 hypothetical protein JX265_003521 [Neoarthrinium moseri]
MVSPTHNQEQEHSASGEGGEPGHGPGRDDDALSSVQGTVGSQHSRARSVASSPAPSPRHGHLTREQVRRQREHGQASLSLADIQRLNDGMLRGLTPPPWPSDLIPNKKRPRTVEEVIEDDRPRDKDKLSAELDELAESSQNKKMKLVSRPKTTDNDPSEPAATKK